MDGTEIELRISGLLKNLYLVIIDKVGECLYDAGEDHEDCADTDADDDVVIRLILVSSCACQHLEEHVSGDNLVSYNVKVDSFFFLSFTVAYLCNKEDTA